MATVRAIKSGAAFLGGEDMLDASAYLSLGGIAAGNVRRILATSRFLR